MHPKPYLNIVSNTIAAFIFLFVIGPFASQSMLQSKADDTANSALNRLLYKPLHQSDIVVVLLNDEAHNHFDRKWPLPRKHWADAANTLACAGARAIFFDIYFHGGLEKTNTLNEASTGNLNDTKDNQLLQKLDNQLWDVSFSSSCEKLKLYQYPSYPIPVYLSSFYSVPVYFSSIGTGDWMPTESTHKLLNTWEPKGFSYPLAQPIDNTSDCITPAPYLHDVKLREHKINEGKQSPFCQTLATSKTWKNYSTDSRVLPLWTQAAPKNQALWDPSMSDLCTRINWVNSEIINALLAWGVWAVESVNELLRALGDTFDINAFQLIHPDQQSSHCPPFLTINLSQVIEYDRASWELLNSEDAGVRNRIVIMSHSLSGAPNLVPAPLHNPQQLPGAYLHATVLENLLTMGHKFDQIPSYSGLCVLVLAIVVFFVEEALKGSFGIFRNATWRHFLPAGRNAWLLGGLSTLCISAMWFRWFLHWPRGMVPWAAFQFTSSILLVRVFDEGKIYEWVEHLISKGRALFRLYFRHDQ